jgi:hypothetical protein
MRFNLDETVYAQLKGVLREGKILRAMAFSAV